MELDSAVTTREVSFDHTHASMVKIFLVFSFTLRMAKMRGARHWKTCLRFVGGEETSSFRVLLLDQLGRRDEFMTRWHTYFGASESTE